MFYLDRFLLMLDSLPDIFIYVLLGFGAFIENVFPPAPGDTITAFGAFLVGTNRLHFFSMYVATTLGSLSGFMFLFCIGSALGRRFFIRRDYRYFKAKDIVRAEEWFRNYGYFLILLNRFLPGVRSVISIMSGISRLQTLKVIILALISCSVWNLIWISMGYSLGSNWETTREKIGVITASYNFAILAFLAVLILFLVVNRILHRSKDQG